MPKPTQASIIRLKHAQYIAAACPETLFTEIALTGSSARGLANDNSDIEINFWLDDIPSIEERSKWLKNLGLANIIAHTEPRPDGSIWINGTYQGIELEAGWQTLADLESSLNELIGANTTHHKSLRLAELILSAKSLRGSGTLNRWQPILQNYPQALSEKLITETLSTWFTETWQTTRNTNPEIIKDDLHRVYRILFALNHHWEINWKWVHHIIPHLEIAPQNLLNILVAISNLAIDEKAKMILTLIIMTLELLDSSIPQRDTGLTICQDLLHR